MLKGCLLKGCHIFPYSSIDPILTNNLSGDFEKFPKPGWAERAKKQLYRSDYVFAHYVHYATVTGGLLQTKEEAKKMNEDWYMHF